MKKKAKEIKKGYPITLENVCCLQDSKPEQTLTLIANLYNIAIKETIHLIKQSQINREQKQGGNYEIIHK